MDHQLAAASMRLTRSLLAGALTVALASPASAIIDGYEPDPADTRFDAICAIGQTRWMNCHLPDPACPSEPACVCGQANHGSGTLIAPNLVLIAAHIGPNEYPCNVATPDPCLFTARFRRGINGSVAGPDDCSTFFDVPIVQFFRPCVPADIALAVLAWPVPHIAPITIDLSLRLEANDPIIQGGWGRISTSGGTLPPGKLFLKNGLCTGVACQHFTYTPGPFIYDSGGAVLVDTPNGLRIVGVITTGSGAWKIQNILGSFNAALSGDYNHDGATSQSDLAPLLANLGPCGDCSDCPFDRNWDCQVDHFEILIPHLAGGQLGAEPCFADLVRDYAVDFNDLSEVILHWGSCPCTDCPGDIDYSGSVDLSDLLYLLDHWGVCPGEPQG